jgi:alpha-acetolactate decarboxylase
MGKLFQASTIFALMSGNFDYTISIEYFLKNGDTGIGSYNGLNGEAIFLDGVAYNATASGNVKIMDIPQTGVTFGEITRFVDSPDIQPIEVGPFKDFQEISDKLSQAVLSRGSNYFYVIKAEGLFSSITVRSAFKQRKPFRAMDLVVKEMKYFTYQNIEGTLVGVYSPSYADGLAVKGWHLHFLSKDKTKGGHVTDLAGEKALVKANVMDKFEVKLPSNHEFASADFAPEKVADYYKAYKAKPVSAPASSTQDSSDSPEPKKAPEETSKKA